MFVGEATLLDVQTSIGDGAQLGHTSSLHAGQSVPAGQRWHGSPAQSTSVNNRVIEPAECGILRKVGFPMLQLFNVVVLSPLGLIAVMMLAKHPRVATLLNDSLGITTWAFYRDTIVISYVAFFAALLGSILLAVTVPRLLNALIEPDKVYALYWISYWAQRVIARMTNVASLNTLFGDSSYIVGFLSMLGYKLSLVEQTGSNFGNTVKHDNPYLCSAGTGTVVADGLAFINADFSSTSFKVSRVSVGARSFLGNNIHYPAQVASATTACSARRSWSRATGPSATTSGCSGRPASRSPARSTATPDRSCLRTRSGDAFAARAGTTSSPWRSTWYRPVADGDAVMHERAGAKRDARADGEHGSYLPDRRSSADLA